MLPGMDMQTLEEPLVVLVEKGGSAGVEAMLEATARLDRALAESRQQLHPRLRHYLERRSYAKALAFLRGQPEEPANRCAVPPA